MTHFDLLDNYVLLLFRLVDTLLFLSGFTSLFFLQILFLHSLHLQGKLFLFCCLCCTYLIAATLVIAAKHLIDRIVNGFNYEKKRVASIGDECVRLIRMMLFKFAYSDQ